MIGTHLTLAPSPTSPTLSLKAAQLRARIADAQDLLAAGGPDVGWHGDALCSQTAPDVFYPEKGDQEAVNLAREICALCPVTLECLADGIDIDARDGIRAGASMYTVRIAVNALAGRDCA